METIVVGVDGSACATEALRWAIAEARLRGARVVALNAWSVPHVSTASEAARLIAQDFAPIRDAANELLDAQVDDALGGAQDVTVDTVAVEGPAAPALIAAAADASLLVVGSRGLGGFKGLLLGSVSQQCAHHSPCPTVIVRSA